MSEPPPAVNGEKLDCGLRTFKRGMDEVTAMDGCVGCQYLID